MTNEKAIMCLEDMKIKVPIPKAAKQARENNEALDVAIKALQSAEPKRIRGKWVPITNGRLGHECDQCHEYAPSYESGNEYLTRFCPNCGSRNEVTT